MVAFLLLDGSCKEAGVFEPLASPFTEDAGPLLLPPPAVARTVVVANVVDIVFVETGAHEILVNVIAFTDICAMDLVVVGALFVSVSTGRIAGVGIAVVTDVIRAAEEEVDVTVA